MSGMTQDFRYGLRLLRRSPGFTAVAVFTLALGIGANIAIFSVTNVVLLHPLPYDQPAQLVLVTTVDKRGHQGGAQPADFLDWRAQNHVFEQMGAKTDWSSYKLTDNNDPMEVVGAPVSAAFFPLLRVRPILGRTFLESEDRPGAPAVVLISEQLWEARYRRDPDILDRAIALDGQRYTVVGVMPAGFALHDTRGERRDSVWIPFAHEFDPRKLAVRDDTYQLRVWARLKSGVPLERAQAEMDVIARRLEQQYPKTNTGRGVRLVRMEEALTARVHPQARLLLRLLLGAVSFVLLIACANVANLLLGRAVSRRQEIAIRMAIGAGTMRIMRQLLTESLLLSTLGGLTGLLVAFCCIQLLPALAPANLAIPRLDQLRIDRYVVAFTVALSMATALVFGLAPAIQTGRRNVNEALKRNEGTSGDRRRLLRSGLMVAEVALSLVLLSGAALLTTTFFRLQQADPGIETEHVLTLRVPAPDREMERFERQPFYAELVRRVEATPGVRAAALANSLPFTGTERFQPYLAGGLVKATSRRVTPGYFEALGITARAGRVFDERDGAASPAVVVINETMARRYWSGGNPIGKQIREAAKHDRVLPDGTVATIVGIVADAKQRLDADPMPEVCFPFSQAGNYGLGTTLIARTAADPLGLAPVLRDKVHELDHGQPVAQIAVLDRILARSIAPQRFNMVLLAAFAAIALALAAAGIYGVISFSVSQRTREIGIRMALGARRSDIARMVLRQGLTAALIGVVLGLAGALGLTRILASQLYGVSPTDPLTLLGVSLALIALAALSSYVPARRAAAVEPMVALRAE